MTIAIGMARRSHNGCKMLLSINRRSYFSSVTLVGRLGADITEVFSGAAAGKTSASVSGDVAHADLNLPKVWKLSVATSKSVKVSSPSSPSSSSESSEKQFKEITSWHTVMTRQPGLAHLKKGSVVLVQGELRYFTHNATPTSTSSGKNDEINIDLSHPVGASQGQTSGGPAGFPTKGVVVDASLVKLISWPPNKEGGGVGGSSGGGSFSNDDHKPW